CGSPWQSKPDRTGCARKPLPVGCVKPAKVSTLDHSWPIADLAYSLPVPGPSGHDGTLWPAEAPRCRSTCRGRAPIDAALGHQYRPRCRSPSSRAPAKDVTMTQPKEAALAPEQSARAWPFEEARRLVKRLENLSGGASKPVVFETGYGPSGLPHIGTFGEVARTSMVRHAFEVLTGGRRKTRLVCFSDDMDGLRKVPDNVPNRDLLAAHI